MEAVTSLFDLAKKAPQTGKPKKEKDVIEILGISPKIKRIKEIRSEMKALEAEGKMIEGEIKPIFGKTFIREYQEQKKRPESFKVTGDKGGELLVIVQDKYIKVDERKAEALAKFDGLLVTTDTYTFNPEVLEKYSEKITPALVNTILSLDIPEADKAQLLIVKREQAVKKGSIDRLMQYSNPQEVYDLIQPIVMLK